VSSPDIKLGAGRTTFDLPKVNDGELKELVCATHRTKGLQAFWDGRILELRCRKCNRAVGRVVPKR
jgi:hypothetical protein